MPTMRLNRRELLRRGAAGGVVLAGGGLAACGGGGSSGSSGQANDLDALRKRGVVRLGFDGEKPYGYLDKDGNLTGSEVDIARHCFKQIGVKQLDGVAMNFDSLIPAIQAGRIDTSFSIYVKPERCPILNFTTPHLAEGQGLIVKAGNPFDLHSFEDVKAKPNVRLGLTSGETTNDIAASVGIPKRQITVFPNTTAEAAGIRAGRVDALILSSGSARTLIEQDSAGLERVQDWKNPTVDGKPQVFYAAFPFLKNRPKVRDAMSGVIEELISTGKLLEITSKYGFSKLDLPGPDAPTLKQLCAA